MDRIQQLASSMRLAHGNLHINLSADTRYDIFVDKDVMKDACPALAPMLRSQEDSKHSSLWDKSTEIFIPGKATQKPTQVFTLGLKYVDETLVLGDNEYSGVPWGQNYRLFCQSTLSETDWPKPTNLTELRSGSSSDYENERATCQYISIANVVHGKPVTLEDLNPFPEQPVIDRCYDIH